MLMENPEEYLPIGANGEIKLVQIVEVISNYCQFLRTYTPVMKTKSNIHSIVYNYLSWSPSFLEKHSRVGSEGYTLIVQVSTHQIKKKKFNHLKKSSYKEQNSRHTSLALHTSYVHSIISK